MDLPRWIVVGGRLLLISLLILDAWPTPKWTCFELSVYLTLLAGNHLPTLGHRVGIGSSCEIYMYGTVGHGKYLSSTESAHGFLGIGRAQLENPRDHRNICSIAKKIFFSLSPQSKLLCYSTKRCNTHFADQKFLLFAPWPEQKQITYTQPVLSAIECWAHFRAPFYVWSGA